MYSSSHCPAAGSLLEGFFLIYPTVPRYFAIFAATVLLVAHPLAGQTSSKPLSVEAIYAHGPLIGTPPEDLSWSPDGKHLT